MNYVYDDGGRVAAGFYGKAGDCVVRAVAIATEQPYAVVYSALADANAATRSKARTAGRRSARNGIVTSATPFKRYMESLGWMWTPTMHIGSGCTVHLADGELPMGRLIVAVSKHYAAVIDGVIHDTHNPARDGSRCVYGYWSKSA